MSAPSWVPRAARGRFLMLALMTGAAVAATYATLAVFFGAVRMLLPGFCAICLLLLLFRRWETNLRSKYLPLTGRRPWCFHVALAACVVGAFFVLVESNYGKHVPGLYCHETTSHLLIERQKDRTKEVVLDLTLTEEWVSLGKSHNGSWYEPRRLHFTSSGRSPSSGWQIRRGETSLTSGDGTRHIPWNGTGIIEMLQDQGAIGLTSHEQGWLQDQGDGACTDWIADGSDFALWTPRNSRWSGLTIYQRPLPRAIPPNGDSPAWMPFAISGLAFTLFAVALICCVAATMGTPVGEAGAEGDGGFRPSDPLA